MSTLHDGVEIQLHVDAPKRSGGVMRFALRLTNTKDHAVDVYLRGREVTFDVIVENEQGDVVWQRLKDEVVQAVLQIRTLAPAETLEASTPWNQQDAKGQRMAPGAYTARASLLTDGAPLDASPVSFEIRRP